MVSAGQCRLGVLLISLQLFAMTLAGPPPLPKLGRLVEDDYEAVELTHPVKVQKVPSLMGYESVLKLIYAVDLEGGIMPKIFPRLREEYENQAMKDIQEGIIDANRETSWVPVNSVVSKPTTRLFGSEDLMGSYMKILETTEIPGFTILKQESSEYAQYLERTWMQEQKSGNASDLALEEAADHDDFVLNDLKALLYNSCIYRLLPADMVSLGLNRTLQEILSSDSLPVNYRFVIPPDNFDLYLNQSIADCMFTPQRAYVIVNVPLVREDSRWQFYRTHNPRFMFDQKVCYIPSSGDNEQAGDLGLLLEPSPESVFAFERNRRRSIGMHNSNAACRLNGINQLCYVGGGHAVPVTRDFDCATAILDKMPVRDLKHRCEFKCVQPPPHHQQIFIDRKSDSVVALTNVRKVRAHCPGFNITKNFERIGSLKMTLPRCDCYVSADDEIFSMACAPTDSKDNGENKQLSNSIPGNNNFTAQPEGRASAPAAPTEAQTMKSTDDTPGIKVSYMIPVTWTKNNRYNMLVEGSLSFKIKNHKEIIDFEWAKPVPPESRSKWGSSFIGGLWDYVE